MRRPLAPFITVSYEELPRVTSEPPAAKASYCCDLCDQACDGSPAGKGLLLWWRGTEMRFDEPPLCEECARSITIGAVSKWALEDEEEG